MLRSGTGTARRMPSQRVPPHVEELAPAPDPLDVVAQLRDLPYLLFLDSGTDPQRLGRYSFVTADPPLVVAAKDGRATLFREGDATPSALPGDPLLAVQQLLAPFAADAVPGLPPFQGGAAGYIGYDYGASLERLPRPLYDDLDIPDVVLGVYDWVIAWDHRMSRAWLMSTGLPATAPDARDRRARARATTIRQRLRTAAPAAPPPGRPAPRDARRPAPPAFPVPGQPGLHSSYPHDGYLAAVARVREYIFAGDIFQANLSQRFEAPNHRRSPWSLYRRLRAQPAPFAAYFEAPGLAVVSASPERFFSVDVGGAVETRPIKGTTPARHRARARCALGRALTESAKDRAENLMIVDLLRNDLSRVCRPGSSGCPSCSRSSTTPRSITSSRRSSAQLDRRSRCDRPAAGGVPRRLDHGRPEGPRDGDHRRARAVAARRLLRVDRLLERHGRARHAASPSARAVGPARPRVYFRPAAASSPTRTRKRSIGRRSTRLGR